MKNEWSDIYYNINNSISWKVNKNAWSSSAGTNTTGNKFTYVKVNMYVVRNWVVFSN